MTWTSRTFGWSEEPCFECAVGNGLILRVEPVGGDRWRVVIVGDRTAHYRSNREFPLDEAKARAVHQGAVVARRLSRNFAEMAELLKREATR